MASDRVRRLSVVRFRWRARLGFFLRAEAGRAGMSYPVPPRTAVLGLCANLLGLPKDALATELEGAEVAVRGALPRTHWHTGNHRKEPPAALPYRVEARGAGREKAKDEVNTQLRQEWLLEPDYEVIAHLPGAHHAALVRRLGEGTSHFTPCMGLSEMLATVELCGEEELERVDAAAGAGETHAVTTVLRAEEETRLDVSAILGAELEVVALTMPRSVTAERGFTHARYFVERKGRALPVHTRAGWRSRAGVVVFL